MTIHILSDTYIYILFKVTFQGSMGVNIKRSLVYVQDTSSFILHLIEERSLDPLQTLVRISLDSGGSFMKIIVNVFDPDVEKSSGKYSNSGVQRCHILAISEDIPESNQNLRLIIDKLHLEEVKFSVAFDLKCANSVFGLSNHAGKRACLYCEGICTAECGDLRTLKSLDYWYSEYEKTGFDKSKMKDCMNVINQRILYLDEDPNTLIQNLVPPPELHLLIGVVSLLGSLLLELWPDFDLWLKSKNILQRGYQGRGWDGNNSNNILKYLDDLEAKIISQTPNLVPFVQCLKDFRYVKNACFGHDFEPTHEAVITKFKNSFMCCQDLSESLGNKLSMTWKVHIILNHVSPFVNFHKCGLGRYAEQVGEAMHSKFKPTWARYKRKEEHPEHNERLLSAVKDFGGRRIK